MLMNRATVLSFFFKSFLERFCIEYCCMSLFSDRRLTPPSLFDWHMCVCVCLCGSISLSL